MNDVNTNPVHPELSANQVAHLTMIQGIVTRLETNCLCLKAVAVSLSVALLAINAALDVQITQLAFLGLVPVGVFIYLDARYLQLGRSYRKLYSAVCQGQPVAPFTMDISAYSSQVPSLFATVCSWSVAWVYGVLLLIQTVPLVLYCW